jgi:hypothetical protein
MCGDRTSISMYSNFFYLSWALLILLLLLLELIVDTLSLFLEKWLRFFTTSSSTFGYITIYKVDLDVVVGNSATPGISYEPSRISISPFSQLELRCKIISLFYLYSYFYLLDRCRADAARNSSYDYNMWENLWFVFFTSLQSMAGTTPTSGFPFQQTVWFPRALPVLDILMAWS